MEPSPEESGLHGEQSLCRAASLPPALLGPCARSTWAPPQPGRLSSSLLPSAPFPRTARHLPCRDKSLTGHCGHFHISLSSHPLGHHRPPASLHSLCSTQRFQLDPERLPIPVSRSSCGSFLLTSPPPSPPHLTHLPSFISCSCHLLHFSVHSLRGTRPDGPCTEACCLHPGSSVFPALQPCSPLCSHVSAWILSCPTKFSIETV